VKDESLDLDSPKAEEKEPARPVIKNLPLEPARTNRLSSFQVLTIVVAFAMTSAVSFLGGVIYDRQTEDAYSEDFQIFWESWNIIDDEFYGDMPSDRERVYGAIQGFVTTLNDPFTAFVVPEQADVHRQFISGKFGGIGASVSIDPNGEPYITRLVRGNPAEEAGLISLDIIRAVDGQPVQGLTLEQVVDMIKGDPGTEVVLTIYRPAEDRTFDQPITRAVIEELTAYSDMVGDVGYLRISSFNAVSASQTQRELEALLAQNPRAIVLDLRGNGGGLLDESVKIADLFLDEGLILSERSRAGEQDRYVSDDGDIGEDVPLVILMDGGSASASEVVAGALQDRDRAILLGQKSYGKGSVQLVHDLPGGEQLRVTVAAWYTPDGRRIHGTGLEPDVVVEGDQFDAQGNDLYFRAALEYINEHYPSESGETDSNIFGG
jgi:carboxyl-terminal processing protease